MWLNQTMVPASPSAHRHVMTSLRNDVYFRLTSPLWCFILKVSKALPVPWAASLKVRRRNVALCLTDVSVLIDVTCATTLRALSLASLDHATRNPSLAKSRSVSRCVWRALCMCVFVCVCVGGGETTLIPTASPLRRKQHCVCHLQFRERPFCDRPRSVPVSAWELFCFLLGDEESCPFSFNKQTAVWINKLKGSGCGPVRTVRSVSLSVCLSCKWARSRLYWSQTSS